MAVSMCAPVRENLYQMVRGTSRCSCVVAGAADARSRTLPSRETGMFQLAAPTRSFDGSGPRSQQESCWERQNRRNLQFSETVRTIGLAFTPYSTGTSGVLLQKGRPCKLRVFGLVVAFLFRRRSQHVSAGSSGIWNSISRRTVIDIEPPLGGQIEGLEGSVQCKRGSGSVRGVAGRDFTSLGLSL